MVQPVEAAADGAASAAVRRTKAKAQAITDDAADFLARENVFFMVFILNIKFCC